MMAYFSSPLIISVVPSLPAGFKSWE